MRRSLAMLTPGVQGLSREDALALLDELCHLQVKLDHLREALRQLADEA